MSSGKTCDAPQLPAHSEPISCSAPFEYNSACAIACLHGFAMSESGQSITVCGADGNWIGEFGVCLGGYVCVQIIAECVFLGNLCDVQLWLL